MSKGRQTALLAATLLLMAVAAYSNSFHNSFHFDDSHTIVNNLYIRTITNIPLFFKDSTTFSSLPSNQSYRPIVPASLATDYWLGSGLDDTFYFHLSMFILFVVQAVLMFFFYRKVFDYADSRSSNVTAALLAAGWYLLHPANAETINYIISRSDSYSAMFIVLAFVMYVSASFMRKCHLYLLPIAFGMLTKPITFIFPVLLLFYIFLFEEKTSLEALLSKSGCRHFLAAAKKACPAFLFMLLTLIVVKLMEPPTWTPGGASKFHYVITQPYVMLKYFISFFLPVALSADTDLEPLKSIIDMRFFTGLIFLGALLAAAVTASAHERLRPISFGILWFFLTLLPTSLIPLAEVMNDHRVFLPYIGLMLAVCWSASLLIDYLRTRVPFRFGTATAAALIASILAASAYGTYQRNTVWKTEETLWKDVTEKSPGNGRGMMNYGLALMARGDYAGAEKYFLKALELTPYYPTLHINLGVIYEATGKTAQAEKFFKKAIFLRQDYPDGYFYYARFLDRQKRFAEAEENLKKTLGLAPAHMHARHLLLSIYQEMADFNRAAEAAAQTLRIAPDDPPALNLLNAIQSGTGPSQSAEGAVTPEYYINLSLGYYREGKYGQSIEAAQKALQLRPGYDLAYNNICAAYNGLQQWDMAIEAGRRAVAANPGNQLAKSNLDWAEQQKQFGQKNKREYDCFGE
jgi:protein O-mannosyl-transferase